MSGIRPQKCTVSREQCLLCGCNRCSSDTSREYIPADCLRDGEQNDSAEVLELLCSTLALEQSKQTSDIGRALHQAQLPWICIARLLSASLSDDCVSAANNKAVHNIVCQMANIRQDKDPLSNGSSSFPDPDLCTSSSESNAGDSSTSAEASGVWEGEPHSGRMPLEGNTVNDMTCTKCRHSFVSQHSPFHVLPLALPSAKVHNSQRVDLISCMHARVAAAVVVVAASPVIIHQDMSAVHCLILSRC